MKNVNFFSVCAKCQKGLRPNFPQGEEGPRPFLRQSGEMCGYLTEILRAGLKQRLMLVAGDVDAHEGAPALQMAHLTEDAAVRGEDALDGLHGAVGVRVNVHGGLAGSVDVLGGHLAAGDQVGDHLGGGYEAALPVGDGDGVQVAHLDS